MASSYVSSKLFRPPYGRMRPAQYNSLRKNYNIVMWDVLSYDFDEEISAEQCFKNVLQNSRNGSIIVFHDSVKAADKMLYVLPQVLQYFTKEGYRFETIPVG
jgi:peptidoglycan/xylan/chitin deacetylase (PgdA/CDA1 family)